MRPDPLRGSPRALSGLLLMGATLAGCGQEPPATPTESRIGRVLPKSGEVWGRDLAAGLGLRPDELCQELGQIDCITDAHAITLGGVDAAGLGIDAPLADPPVSAPMAVDRVAQSACALRYARDLDGPAVIFGPVLDADLPHSRARVATALVERLLGRETNPAELQGFEQLYADLQPVSDDLRRDWSIGACVVVSTSLEALFY